MTAVFNFIRKFLDRRWLRFGMVGLCATVSYYALGLLFVRWLGLPLMLGNFLAYVLSFAVSYLGQCLWTFEARGNHAATLPRFAMAQVIGLILNSLIIANLARLHCPYEISMLAAIAIVPVIVFFICKYWVFRDAGKSGL